jgi:hypothetical protein
MMLGEDCWVASEEDGGGLGVTFFISMLLEFNGAAPNHFHMMGGDCTQVWKTGDLGTRRTRKCPAHSRHNKNSRQQKSARYTL